MRGPHSVVFGRTLLTAALDPDESHVAIDRAGGTRVVLQRRLAWGAVHGDALTIERSELQAALSWVPAAAPESFHGCAS